jgi:phospholipid/cholesterol/gamma-HCH transport system substrate-binding protein
MAVSREVKVGLFVLLGLIGAGSLIFLIGDNRSLFDRKVSYRALFDDVQGVKPGSTVRMGGLDIGTVSSVRYPEDPNQRLIDVKLNIVRRESQRIREGSVASIAPKGLLGDKMVTITAGHPDEPPVPAGGVLKSAPAEDFTLILSRLDSLTRSAQSVLVNLESATNAIADEEFTTDVKRGVAALSQILVSLDTGSGYAARLLHDEAEANRISKVVGNLEQTTARLDHVLLGIDQVVERVNVGPGLAHEVVYGESGSRALAQVGSAADELGKVLAGVREGDGLAHGLLFGNTGAGGDSALGDKVAGDVAAMSSDLRAILGDMRQGKGTLGALLVDPSIYEDLKLLLGNVQRNQALRALVRYSIQRDDGSPGVQVVDPDEQRNARDGDGREGTPTPSNRSGVPSAAQR